MRIHPSLLLTALVWVPTVAAYGGESAGDGIFSKQVQPILREHCLECHGADAEEGELRLDQLGADFDQGDNAETWHDVLNKLNLGEMPPEDAEPLDDAERDRLVDWITAQLRAAAQRKRLTRGPVRLRRLTRYEYSNTLRDLLGVGLDYARDLPPEPKSADGFQNNASALGISPLQMELYLAAARRGLQQAIVTGEPPTRVHETATESAKGKSAKRNPTSNRLDRTSRFILSLDDFPREGEIVVRVRAKAIVPDNAPLPRMRVAIGLRADVRSPEKDLAEVDLAATDATQAFEFRGRIEQFPLPGHNPKFPGLRVTIYNQFEGAAPKPKKRKKKKQADAAAELPTTDPLIEIESVEFEGPVFVSWPPPSHTRILFPGKDEFADEAAYAAEVIRRFTTRAFRRPATDEDVQVAMKLYERLRPKYDSLAETMREVLAFTLISPDFLYLVETRSAAEGSEPLNDFEFASRLSYFLWSSMPDQQLFELASAKRLQKPEVIQQQVARMLGDSRAEEFVQRFANQWLDLDAVDRVAVNPEFHPQFDDRLKADMRTESLLLFATVLNDNLNATTLLDAEFTMLNRRLAKHYGLSGPRGLAFERVSLRPEDRRGGLLTHASFLLANSNGEQSHPIKRAVWLLDRLLDNPPAPPPPDVPELDPEQKDLAGLSLKQQLAAHRTKPACNSCHRRIDPWGIAFEHYDAVGRWRETPTQPNRKRKTAVAQIDSQATLPDGAVVDGVESLKRYLLEHKRDRFAAALVKRLLTYGLGRTLDWSDQPEVDKLTLVFAEDEYRLKPLISAIVASEAFRSK